MARGDVFPRADLPFLEWSRNFVSRIKANPTLYGVPTHETNTLHSLFIQFENAMNAIVTQGRNSSLTLAKNTTKAALESYIRIVVRSFIANNRNLTDQQRHDLGLNFPRRRPTPNTDPTEFVAHRVRVVGPSILEIIFGREGDPSAGMGAIRRGRPRGAASCELQFTVLPADKPGPVDKDGAFECLIETRSPFRITFPAHLSGHRVWFTLRWIGTTSKEGPWNAWDSAIIP